MRLLYSYLLVSGAHSEYCIAKNAPEKMGVSKLKELYNGCGNWQRKEAEAKGKRGRWGGGRGGRERRKNKWK
jgi:hypothetical protein